jgi:hypothetical protein
MLSPFRGTWVVSVARWAMAILRWYQFQRSSKIDWTPIETRGCWTEGEWELRALFNMPNSRPFSW